MSIIKQSTEFAGRTLTLETGRLAERASGSVLASYGETVVLATAVVTDVVREGIDFFPLLVDYEEKFYATGKISGSRFIKREGRPSEAAILNARLIDRPIRPLFPKGFRHDVQVIVTVLSVDKANDPAIIGMIAASTALLISKAPFQGPIAGVRVGSVAGKLIVNPSEIELNDSDLDLVVAGSKDKVLMIEAGARQLPETAISQAISAGQQALQAAIELQQEFARAVRPQEATDQILEEAAPLHHDVDRIVGQEIPVILEEVDKARQEQQLSDLEAKVLSELEGNYKQVDLKTAFGQLVEKKVRLRILKENARPDGRTLDEVRPLNIEIGLLPRVHGSGLFSRGQTQSLTTVTLGAPGEEQMIDTMMEEGIKRYMHHYNFPPFSTGEVKPVGRTGRRDIGHGALAERALEPVIPPREDFPYTIRVVSEILSSNGSSSMAATCGSTLALLDAGVPLSAPVAGIAIGMVSDETQYKLLTDIQGIEDFGGDMDFKVAGTATGITAIQLDMKVPGISQAIIDESLGRARTARLLVLERMNAVISSPKEISLYAPRVTTIKIDPEKLGMVIGPGGKNIKAIVERAGGEEITTINLEDDGTVFISSRDAAKAEAAISEIKGMTEELIIGSIYDGIVEDIIADQSGNEIGAIVRITPFKEGMVHISQIADWRVPDISSVLSVGQAIKVKVMEIDRERGRVKLSYKEANPPLEKPAGYVEPPAAPRSFGGAPRRGERRGPRY